MDHALHLPTIMVVHALVTLISTLLLVYMWWRYRGGPVLSMLAIAGFCACASLILHAFRAELPLPIVGGLGLFFGACSVGFYWQAVVAFEGGKTSVPGAVAGGVIWGLLWILPVFRESVEARSMGFGVLIGAYCFLTAREILVAGHAEPLPSRMLAVLANTMRGLIWLSFVPLTLLFGAPYDLDGNAASWFGAVTLGNLVLIVLSLVSLLIMAKERDELRYRLASERDPLTNLSNRRTFVAEAERHLRKEERVATLLLFDIDHFKAINDTYGHAMGDEVLLAFSRAIEQRLPKEWPFARIGGEEFACLMPSVSAEHGMDVAESLRAAIADLRIGAAVNAKITVSIGVSEVLEKPMRLDHLLASADAALYRAKADGRNCVRLYQPAELLLITGERLAGAADEVAEVQRHPTARSFRGRG